MQMRRVATFIVAVGITIIGIGGTAVSRPGAGPPGAAGGRLATLRLAGQISHDAAPVKVVRFAGYTIDVPANWPVYDLDRHPATCYSLNRNAVYLGHPGANQNCPARLVGRVATISLQVPSAADGPAAGLPAADGPAAFPVVGNLPRVGGSVVADSQDHVLHASLQSPGLSVSATYGSAAASMIKIIQSLRRSPSGLAAATQPAGTAASSAAAPVTPAGGAGSRSGVGPGRANTASGHVTGKGFDACTAPSLAVMQAWHKAFSYAGIYIGGAEVGCGYGNLTAAWVSAVTSMGWGLIPTYVGRQATCNKQFKVRVLPAHAAAEGHAAALDAVQHAAAFGMGPRTPIYYDMESFNTSKASCLSAVLTFLDGWTRQIHASGYVSGVYSSASTGAEAVGLATVVDGHLMAKPDSLWFAFWDGQSNVIGTPYLPDSWWRSSRIKQYMGAHNRKINGFTLNIDADLVRGAVFR
jgi:hypothetical protein